MFGGAVRFPSANPLSSSGKSLFLGSSNLSNSKLIKLRASISEFPLASRIIVRSNTSIFQSCIIGGLDGWVYSRQDLSYSTSDTSLKSKFSNFGEVVEVKLVKDESGKRSKGYAFIQYTSQDDAMLALENMDHKPIDGRMVYVEIAKPVTKTFGAYPRTSGPPTEKKFIEANETEGFNL